MELLKYVRSVLIAVPLLVSLGCVGDSVTYDQVLQTDTYISSQDSSNHSDLPYLNVSKSASLEERAIVKLPTGQTNYNNELDQALQNPVDILFLPFFIIFNQIFEDIFDCPSANLNAANLTKASLQIGILQGTPTVQMFLLSKPWFQTANWTRTHFFSRSGVWANPGGDTDPTFLPITGTVSGTTLSFDITSYFMNILGTQPVHYGFLLESANGNPLAQVQLTSVEYTGATAPVPQLVTTYNCVGAMMERTYLLH